MIKGTGRGAGYLPRIISSSAIVDTGGFDLYWDLICRRGRPPDFNHFQAVQTCEASQLNCFHTFPFFAKE